MPKYIKVYVPSDIKLFFKNLFKRFRKCCQSYHMDNGKCQGKGIFNVIHSHLMLYCMIFYNWILLIVTFSRTYLNF